VLFSAIIVALLFRPQGLLPSTGGAR
jgi:hypothetical protein